jgi:hypothetical protein
MLDRVGARVVGVVVWGLEAGAGGAGYGYYHDAYYGAHHYYGYYSKTSTGGRSGKKREGPDSGARLASMGNPSEAQGVASVEAEIFVPKKSLGRKIAEGVGNVLGALLGIVLVLALAATIVYFLDGYFGWGVVDTIRATLW